MHKLLFICFFPPYVTEANKWNTGKGRLMILHDYKTWIEGFPTSISSGFFKFGMSHASSSVQDSSTSGAMNYHQDRVSYPPLQTKLSWTVFTVLEATVNTNDNTYLYIEILHMNHLTIAPSLTVFHLLFLLFQSCFF